MRRFFSGLFLIFGASLPMWATPLVSTTTVVSTTTPTAISEPPANPEGFDSDDEFAIDDREAKSGEILTPTSAYTQKKPYDMAHDALQKATGLWNQKLAQKSSDAALEAYDDLMEIHFPRRQKKARKKLREERRQAAQIYIESSIAYIKKEVEKEKNTAAAKQEARARLGDLRDVSREYLDLQKQVVNAIMELQ